MSEVIEEGEGSDGLIVYLFTHFTEPGSIAGWSKPPRIANDGYRIISAKFGSAGGGYKGSAKKVDWLDATNAPS